MKKRALNCFNLGLYANIKNAMNPFVDFLLKNFFLLCLTLSVIFLVLRSYRTKVIPPLYPILIVSTALLLSIVYFVEIQSAPHDSLVFLTTLCCSLGFILRPVILYFFMCLSIKDRRIRRIARILITINAVVYLLALFLFADPLKQAIFYYKEDHSVHRGPLFYTCHLLVFIMAAYFVIRTLLNLRGRHKFDAIACLVSVGFIGIAVIIESFLVAEYLLNTTIAIACLFYIIHLYQQQSVRDALTGLFDRKAYYNDLDKIKSKVTGLIVLDMNSLKAINDSQGHVAGDTALKTIADVILKSINEREMDAYRMGGDEFIILSLSTKENILENTANKIKEEMAKTPYSVAIGYAQRKENMRIHDLSLLADEMMYKDKTNYYITNKIERRKNDNRKEQNS